MQAQKLESLGIVDVFETVVHGGHDAAAKPSPEPFHYALDGLDSAPERAIHVGNSLESDVAGAKAAGCLSGWVPADPAVTPNPTPDYAFPDLDALHARPWRP